ncbi:response regulator [Pseudomonas sp. CFBP 13602]|uniref:response regulator n=1 Tax=Pseudomonas sp. CFBP 13602 TaxID=2774039 RepID=UPI0017859781|nr:response regulator [Pseudomonas sp. CFBP 13602]MBD8826805.1 response regulator [Pseudomonas sp. CFBP 13602]
MAERHEYVLPALCEELLKVKEQLDLFVRGGREYTQELNGLTASLRQIADALAVLGFGQPRKVIIDQLAVIQSLVQGTREPNDAVLMDVAGALLYVEATLAGMAGPSDTPGRDEQQTSSTDLVQIRQLVMRETRFGLQEARDILADSSDGRWDRQRLRTLVPLLTQLRGALVMLPLPRAAAVLQGCNDAVQAHLLDEPTASVPVPLEQVTAALAAVEHYLQRTSEAPQLAHESLLAVAEAGLAAAAPTDPHGEAHAATGPEPDPVDTQLLEIFHSEALSHLSAVERFLALDEQGNDVAVTDELQRALHTLKGSALVAGVTPLAELATAFDVMARELRAHRLPFQARTLGLLGDAHYLMRQKLLQLPAQPLTPIPGAGELIRQVQEHTTERLQGVQTLGDARQVQAPQLIERLLDEGMDILLDAERLLQRWQQTPASRVELPRLLDQLTLLGEQAQLTDVQALDELCEALLDLYGAVEESSLSVSTDFFQQAEQAQEAMIGMLDQLAAGQEVKAQPTHVRALRALLQGALAPHAMGVVQREGGAVIDLALLGNVAAADADDEGSFTEESIEQTQRRWLSEPGYEGASRHSSHPGPLEPGIDQVDDADGELLGIFIEEGLDIVESAGAALVRWQAEPGNHLEAENLLRDLHTLKGGARMVEIGPLGDLAHELESVYERISQGQLQASSQLFGLLHKGHDRLAQMLDAVRSRQALPAAGKLIAAIAEFAAGSEPAGHAGPAASAKPAVAEPVAAERGPVDVIKVGAELLDELGNLAGETAIFRGRIEQQVNDAQAALQEMETTIERMRDQLRRLDTETQGRILSRQQVDGQAYEDFDPLEMDRHSHLQQLSRALFESASDLLDLKETLAGRNLEAQTLLQQQARVDSQLQEGLMRTRMVPFERLLPRLQRVVRQVAEALGKEVEFEVSQAQGEMDRSVLERMIAPLEHMLRNAVDHGLEPLEQRLAAGKPAAGHIRLALLHQGGDIVIEMSDDGAGVPLQAVRAKAIKRGLLDPHSDLSDHDVLQFILQPGFSTATKVTQISGRGLGMDVVHEEVKQLGGAMSIDSRPGQGARFQIRLPFTVSVNRALMVQCGEEQYAIPLNSIEGIVRVMPGELHDAYQSAPPRYGYAGRVYDLRYLGTLLHGLAVPSLTAQSQPLPVLLVRAFDQQVAVQVDALAGSREIVVKSLGSQFAAVPGLGGATILGDGSVVLILDLLAQLRARQGVAVARAGYQHGAQVRRLQVLVVDDSVTVRKVTSRLLERHGMQVLTAKDGVDAMALLQEHSPDILLLDIEMPRMDGFEVARRIRQHPTLKDLPIIMITSRTGQKHRERAMAIGVNEYLGKPYQESQLLECIERWGQVHA